MQKALFLCVGNEKFEKILLEKMQHYFPHHNIQYLLLNAEFESNEKFKIDTLPIGRISRRLSLIRYLVSANTIVLNSLFFSKSILKLMLFISYFKELTWIVWGGDLYHDYPLQDEAIRKKLISRLKKVAITIPADEDYLRQKYPGFKGEITKFFFPIPLGLSEIKNLITAERADGKRRILLGNSATATNNHYEIIDLLSQLQDWDYQLYLPLGYGDHGYAIAVQKYAEEKLGTERIVAINKFLEFPDYLKMLQEIDIAIFNQSRQQGGHNIFISLALGMKVFINPANCIASFVKNLGATVYSTEELKNFESLSITPDEAIVFKKNNEKLALLFDDSLFIKNLTAFFTDLNIEEAI